MTIRIPIRRLTSLRPGVADQTLLDYLDLAIIAPEPGLVGTSELRDRWRCSQSHVSRRINAVAAAGLAEITAGWGAYRVHGLGLTVEIQP
jgi:hypothetical protein